jgi:hypothetical protein
MNAYRNGAERPEPTILVSNDRLQILGTAVRTHKPEAPWLSSIFLPLILVACALHPARWDFVLVMAMSISTGYLWHRWSGDMDVWQKAMTAVKQIEMRMESDDG